MSAVVRQVFVVAMAVLLGGAAIAAAQQPDAAAAGQGSQFQQRLAQIVQRQLGLTDAQLQQVIAVNKKYEQSRFLLVQQEREIRITIRDEVLRGDQADQARVSRLLDEMMKVQSQRLQILQDEQKDLSAFLSPVQRAKYLGIQEQVRKRLEQIRQRGADGSAMPQGQGMQQGQGMRRRMQQQQQQPPPPSPPPSSATPPASSPTA
jgi:Spy/CpxP family protein refolding chaperone